MTELLYRSECKGCGVRVATDGCKSTRATRVDFDYDVNAHYMALTAKFFPWYYNLEELHPNITWECPCCDGQNGAFQCALTV